MMMMVLVMVMKFFIIVCKRKEFSGRPVSDLFENQVGRAFLFFPMGLTMSRWWRLKIINVIYVIQLRRWVWRRFGAQLGRGARPCRLHAQASLHTFFFSQISSEICVEDRWPSKVVLFRSFAFRPEYRRMAQLVLSRAKAFFAEKENKMRKKKEKKMGKKERQRKSQTTFVGIHNRRGDHIQYQKEVKYYTEKHTK